MTKKSGGRSPLKKIRSLVSCVEENLVEGRSKQSAQDVTGRTRSNKIVNFKGDLELTGKLIPVQITKAFPHSLRGEMFPTHCRLQELDCRVKNSEILI